MSLEVDNGKTCWVDIESKLFVQHFYENLLERWFLFELFYEREQYMKNIKRSFPISNYSINMCSLIAYSIQFY